MVSVVHDEGPKSVSRRWMIWVVLGTVAWSGYLVQRAARELTDVSTIDGLFRSYDAPFEGTYGAVIDPRRWSTAKLLQERFSVRGDGPARNAPPDAWCAWLKASDIDCEVVEQVRENDTALQLRFISGHDQPHLLLGRFGLNHVFFVPNEGVTLSVNYPPSTVIVRLPKLMDAPW